MRRRLGLLLILLMTASCSGRTDPRPSSESTETLPIQVDGTDESRQASALSFFPNQVAARPGDELEFDVHGVGEPHTVSFGALVDTGLKALDKVAPKSVKDAYLGEPAEMFVLPSVFGPAPTYTPENQAAGQPCYLQTGEPPVADPCPKAEKPAFDGVQSFHSSGLLQEGSSYEIKLSKNIEPGDYRFMCLIHRGLMTGTIKVVGEEEERPDSEQVEARGRTELETAIDNLDAAFDRMGVATPDSAYAGVGSGKRPFELAMAFGPETATLGAGEKFAWSFSLCHTISFNPPPDAFGDLKRHPDGSVRLNPLAYAPSQAPPPPPLSFDPASPPVRFDGGKWDGTGFFNSGGICSLADGDIVYELAFTRPGTYEVRCLFHPSMKGTIKVV